MVAQKTASGERASEREMAWSVVKNAMKGIREKGVGNFLRELKEEGYLYVFLSLLFSYCLRIFAFVSVTKVSSLASLSQNPLFIFVNINPISFYFNIYTFCLM